MRTLPPCKQIVRADSDAPIRFDVAAVIFRRRNPAEQIDIFLKPAFVAASWFCDLLKSSPVNDDHLICAARIHRKQRFLAGRLHHSTDQF
ncbi:hypothetical protein CO662_26410 [Rhizobium anhuiense]|uniref:Uncharacterized protein n=1 Tax=Rhizobium anhuiense TaxID=1184720 RepID=A0A3S0S0E3_9HYPH|nr:hypothetical protein CO668_25065 [Rhizobium anhuiense]PDS49163.1 hypothetical protein CO662_26410 [Rhizobium anhuiense]RUL97387.1 hypothetical protein EEQ99_27545 [Rhizobium anhuiense]